MVLGLKIRKRGFMDKAAGVVLAVLFVFLGPPLAAQAHRVTLFAWVQANKVHVQGTFGSGKPVKGGRIVVHDRQGNTVTEGKTDENGEFSFPITKKETLRLVLEAGMGHRAEWTVPAEELAQIDTKEPASNEHPPAPSSNAEPTVHMPRNLEITRQDIEKIVDQVVDKKLQPVIRMLTRLQETGPSLRDILAGIGYILGLAGIAAYILGRKKREDGRKS
jgi:nickel transport protein